MGGGYGWVGLRTSAARAAAARGSSDERSVPPTVRPWLSLCGVGRVGAGAVVLWGGGCAEPRVRPCPAKGSFDCFPQRFPIWVGDG